MPLQHLVAFCSDLGFTASHGPAMLSLLLACAFLSRQFWGWLADRIGGLRTVLATSVCQALAMSLFLTTQTEFGLFTISAIFGFGFAGLIPGYVLTVRDTGMGMSKSEIANALIPFGQNRQKMSVRHEGTGLGLPLAKAMMELHGGSLTVESIPGRGTTVFLRFPASRVIQTARQAAA